MKYLLLIAVSLFLMSCDEVTPENSLNKDFDRSGRPQKITVYVYDNRKAMRQAKKDFDGQDASQVEGWAKWSNKESSGCEIHVVKIRSKNDKRQMETWGHELTHCMYGSFHEEGFKG